MHSFWHEPQTIYEKKEKKNAIKQPKTEHMRKPNKHKNPPHAWIASDVKCGLERGINQIQYAHTNKRKKTFELSKQTETAQRYIMCISATYGLDLPTCFTLQFSTSSRHTIFTDRFNFWIRYEREPCQKL